MLDQQKVMRSSFMGELQFPLRFLHSNIVTLNGLNRGITHVNLLLFSSFTVVYHQAKVTFGLTVREEPISLLQLDQHLRYFLNEEARVELLLYWSSVILEC